MALSELNEGQAKFESLVNPFHDSQGYDTQQCLSYLYDIVVKSHVAESYNSCIKLMLELGKKRLCMENALVTRPVSDTVYEVLAFASDQKDAFYVGQHISTADFLCHQVKVEDGARVVADTAEINGAISPVAYGGLDVRSYLGHPVKSRFSLGSVLCFFSSAPINVTLDEENLTLLEKTADGIAFLIDQQRNQAQRKNVDATMFANGSMSTLDEYLEQANIPDLYGIPGRVVDVLKARIGQLPLSIGHVAQDLELSKRTLQRRLQQQSVNFAELRDQVRYHYSIGYLVKNSMSIDGISVALDFSDRTSFTNAFKRWTGMSPSTFRKLFRDFV